MKVTLADTLSYFRSKKVSIWHKLVALFAILYVISPFDLIPDFIPIVGWFDDIGVVALVVAWYLRQISHHREQRHSTAASRPILPLE